jgi:hypothetical protein
MIANTRKCLSSGRGLLAAEVLFALLLVSACSVGGCPAGGTNLTPGGTANSGDDSGVSGDDGDADEGDGAGAGGGDDDGADGGDDGNTNDNAGDDNDAGDEDENVVGESADMAGLQVFPPDNPWNQDISGLPAHPNSAALIASMGEDTGLHPDFGTVWEGAPIGIPYTVVDADTPMVEVFFEYADESDAGPYPVPADALVEGGPNADGDLHVLLVDRTANKLYELFYAFRQSDGSWTAGSGAIFDLSSNGLRPPFWTSADAAGLPIFPGLVRYDEVAGRGEITHALRFTVSRTRRAFIPPATHFASEDTNADLPPMGLRVRLKADYDISGYSPNVQVILRALKKYGMFVADNGSDWYISGAPDSRWDDDELHELGQVTGSAFEAVYTGEAITD